MCCCALPWVQQVLKLTYPYQPALRDWGRETEAAQCSFFSMPAPLFYELHSFHLIMDSKMHLLQWGAAVGRVEPGLEVGKHVRDVFRVRISALRGPAARASGRQHMGSMYAYVCGGATWALINTLLQLTGRPGGKCLAVQYGLDGIHHLLGTPA